MLIRNKFNGYSRDGIRLYHFGSGGGGGGGGGGPSQTTAISELPEWARPYAQESLERGRALSLQPYTAFGGERIAGFQPLQTKAQTAAGELTPAVQLGQATGLAGLAGTEAFRLGQYAPGQFGVESFARPGSAEAFMSPYMQSVVERQQQAAQREADIQGQAIGARAAQAGAFGGARQGIQEAQARAALARQKGDIQATGLQSAFQQAQQQFNLEQDARMRAQQLGEQSRQFGAGLGLQGLGMGLQAAGQLGQLGQTQFGQQQGIINLQSQLGAQQQALEQQRRSQAYQDFLDERNYPYRQLGFMSDLIRGLPLGQQTAQQVYPGQPGAMQSLASLGMGAYGLSRLAGMKEGGEVKDMAEGGYAEISDKVRADPTKYSEAQIRQAVKNGVLDAQTAAIALEQIAKARQAAAGIDVLPSGLTTQEYAPGGIVAFDEGGDVKRYQSAGFVSGMPGSLMGEELGLSALEGAPRLSGIAIPESLTGKVSYPTMLDIQAGKYGQTETEILKNLNMLPATPVAPATTVSAAPTTPSTISMLDAGTPPAYSGPTAESLRPRTAADIYAQAREVGKGAVPAGLASLALPEVKAADILKRQKEIMPKGEAAYTSELTPMFEELRGEREKAARERYAESEKIAERMDALRESQARRTEAKKKDLETDRDRTVGIAFLEAAQAMAQPGKGFIPALVEAGAAGGKRYLADKERLDKRADELADAVNRLDEARVGDARERAAAKDNLQQSLLASRDAMIQHYQTVLGLTRADAIKAVDAELSNQTARANYGLQQLKIQTDAQQAATDSAIRAVGAEAQLAAAQKPGAQVELFTVLGDGDPRKGAQLLAAAQQERVSPEKLFTDLLTKWEPLKMGRPAPSYFEFLAMINRTTGGTAGANPVLPRKD